jgi:anthranilate phosphoribosyltransferase
MNLGCGHALIVHGSDGLDEITITGSSRITEVDRRGMRTFSLDPRSLGLEPGRPEELVSRGIEENVAMCRDVLAGRSGARRDVVLLNSAAGLVAAGRADDFTRGIAIAAESIDSGRAREVLDRLIRFTNG